jgi:hypothetical protein
MQLINIRVSEIHFAQMIITEVSFNAEVTASRNFKLYKFPGMDLIPAEPIRTGNR